MSQEPREQTATGDLIGRPVDQTLRIYKAIAAISFVSAGFLLAYHLGLQLAIPSTRTVWSTTNMG